MMCSGGPCDEVARKFKEVTFASGSVQESIHSPSSLPIILHLDVYHTRPSPEKVTRCPTESMKLKSTRQTPVGTPQFKLLSTTTP